MQCFAMRTYSHIVDFFIGIQIYGRYCHKSIKAVFGSIFMTPLIFKRRF